MPTTRQEGRLLRLALRARAHALIVGQGYVLDRDGIPRGLVAGAETSGGRKLKVAVRAGVDRWIAVTQQALAPDGDLSIADELFVITFANAKTRDTVQLWRFDAKVVAEMARKVFAASGKSGQQWLPLDDTRDVTVHSMAAGSLGRRGELLVEAPWQEDAMPDEDGDEDQASAPRLTIAEAKAGLAAHFGVSPEAIKITIEG